MSEVLIPGSLLGQDQLSDSLDFLESIQLSSGMIPWFVGGKADPWNHTEVAVALALGGRVESALRALEWLRISQNKDGSWCHFYQTNGISEPRRDTNTCCYPVLLVSVLERTYAANGDFIRYVDMALDAIEFVLGYQNGDGSIPWAIDPDGSPHSSALIAAAASLYDSIQVAIELAHKYRQQRVAYFQQASKKLKNSLLHPSDKYQPTKQWAMDHYYPILAGMGTTPSRIDDMMSQFYEPDWGIRCRLPNDWFTAAETAECAMALQLVGYHIEAKILFQTLRRFRQQDGSYFTGITWPAGHSFPNLERSSYSVAAVVISSFVLAAKGAERRLSESILTLLS